MTFSWDSAFWIYNWVADMIRPRYNLMVEDMRTVQNTLEDTYAQSQEGIEIPMHNRRKALKVQP